MITYNVKPLTRIVKAYDLQPGDETLDGYIILEAHTNKYEKKTRIIFIHDVIENYLPDLADDDEITRKTVLDTKILDMSTHFEILQTKRDIEFNIIIK